MSNQNYRYDIALSFAGEDRKYANELAQALKACKIDVFYDEYEEAQLWGKNLYTYLSEVYQKQARFCVMFLSQSYAQKLWTNHEREAAQARAFEENKEYILPIRLDETKIPGIPPTIGYQKWSNADSIADIIIKKLKQQKETLSQHQLHNNLVNTANEILKCVDSSLKENQKIITPFLQNKSKREEVLSKVESLFNNQRDRGNFGTWQATLEHAILQTKENPQLQDAINQLLKILRQFHQSFYSYYKSNAENPEKYQTPKYEKYFIAYALNKEQSGFADEKVDTIAREYLESLRDLVEKMGSITFRLKTLVENNPQP